MLIHATKALFAWEELDDSPALEDLRQLLAALPDAKLLESLRVARGKGRDDYPVGVLWGVEILRIALRHVHLEDCLAELRRNAGLRRLIGIDHASQVPAKWNMSRFEEVLGKEPHRTYLKDVFAVMVRRIAAVVPDLGSAVAGDATALSARRKRKEAAQKAERDEGLPQPSGGRKEYTEDDGTVTKVVKWFGYKLHLIVDVKHEVVLSYCISDTKAGDGETLPVLLQGAQRNLPECRIKTLAYDKAADTNEVHKLLHGEGIKPIIQIRSLWKDETERMLPGHDGNVNGARRFTAQVGLVLIVHVAFATLLASAPRYDGPARPKTLGQTRLSTISKALRERLPV